MSNVTPESKSFYHEMADIVADVLAKQITRRQIRRALKDRFATEADLHEFVLSCRDLAEAVKAKEAQRNVLVGIIVRPAPEAAKP